MFLFLLQMCNIHPMIFRKPAPSADGVVLSLIPEREIKHSEFLESQIQFFHPFPQLTHFHSELLLLPLSPLGHKKKKKPKLCNLSSQIYCSVASPSALQEEDDGAGCPGHSQRRPQPPQLRGSMRHPSHSHSSPLLGWTGCGRHQ